MNWTRAVLVTTIGVTLLLACPQAGARCQGDLDGNNEVTVNEIITAVNNALVGCEPPVSILGRYEGQGFEIRMGCMDPGDDGTFAIDPIIFEATMQVGSSYEGTLSLVEPDGEPLVQEIQGTVDSTGVTEGMSFIEIDGVPVPSARFSGHLVGNILIISVAIGNQACESDAASFSGTRD